jgi:hypothetical protein
MSNLTLFGGSNGGSGNGSIASGFSDFDDQNGNNWNFGFNDDYSSYSVTGYEVSDMSELKETIADAYNLNSDFLSGSELLSYADELKNDIGIHFSSDLSQQLLGLNMLDDWSID